VKKATSTKVVDADRRETAETASRSSDDIDSSSAVVTITTMNSRQLIKQLEADGWILRGVKGSHHIFTHPSKPGHLSIPHPKQDLGVGLVRQLLKQAGLSGRKP